MPPLLHAAIVTCSLVLARSHDARAQAADTGLATRPDSTRRPAAQSAWVAGALGIGSERTLAYNASLNYSRARLLVTARAAGVGAVSFSDTPHGPNVDDEAVLVGLRTADRGLFLTGAIGPAMVSGCPAKICDGPNVPWRGALAFEGNVHATAIVAGLGLATFGVLGPKGLSYAALTLSLQLGWFGR